MSAAYVQRNLRPKVTSLTVHPAGTVFQKPYPTGDPDIAGFDDQAPDRRILSATPNPGGSSSSALGRRAYQRGLQTFVWRAEDANDDELRYEILYRREGETAWKSLKSDLEEAIFVWDTTSVPNGTYVVKVVASDSASNTPALRWRASSKARPSTSTTVLPPIVVTSARLANGRTTIQFDVRDEWSSISKVEYLARCAALAGGLSARRHLRRAHRAVRADTGQRGRCQGTDHSSVRCEEQLRNLTRRCPSQVNEQRKRKSE